MTRCTLPHLFGNWGSQALQVILVFSVFTSLAQAVLFTRGL
jgi:hypothetical protein